MAENQLMMINPFEALETGRKRAYAGYEAGQAAAQRETLNELYAQAADPMTGRIDRNRLMAGLAQRRMGAMIPQLEAEEAKLAEQRGKATQEETKALEGRMQYLKRMIPADPRLAPAWVEAAYADPIVGAQLSQLGSKEEVVAGIPQDPEGYASWVEGASMFADELSKRRVLTAEQEATEREREFRRGLSDRELAARGRELGVSEANVRLRGREASLAERRFEREGDLEFQSRVEQMKAAGKFKGESLARAEADLPGAVTRADTAIDLIDQMVGRAPEKDASGKVIKGKEGTAPHPGFRAAVGAGVGERFIPGTDAAGFQALYDQVTGGAFLQAYETLKGTGQITEIEGKKATAAITRMNLAQNEKEFIAAAREFQSAIRTGVKNARAKAGKPTAATAGAQTTTGGTSYQIIED
jgi:hypothetical protein